MHSFIYGCLQDSPKTEKKESGDNSGHYCLPKKKEATITNQYQDSDVKKRFIKA